MFLKIKKLEILVYFSKVIKLFYYDIKIGSLLYAKVSPHKVMSNCKLQH